MNIADLDAEATENKKGGLFWPKVLAGESVTFESTQKRKNGSIFPVEVNLGTITLGKEKAVIGLVRDITERKKMMNALRESEEKYRRQFEEALDAIFVADAETGILVDCNPAACELVGRTKSEIVGMHQRILHPPEEKEGEFSRTFKEHLGKKKGRTLESQVITKSGEIKDVAIKASIFTLGNKTLLQGSFRDITERKRAEESIRLSEMRYRSLYENSSDGVMMTKPDGTILSANPQACRMLGMTEDEITSTGRAGIVVRNEKLTTALEVRERTGSVSAELTFKRKDGSTFTGEISSSVFTDTEGITKTCTIIRNVTERKKMEDALRQDQDLLEAITENLGAGFVIISKDYRVQHANRFVKNNVGEVEGKQCYASLNTLDHICPDCGVKKVFEDGVAKDSHEYSQVGVDGKPYYVELIATPLKDKDGNVTAALEFVVDIAEKKHMQQKLQANEAKFRAISDSAIDAIFMFDEEDRITYWNPAAEQIFGYTEKEICRRKSKRDTRAPSLSQEPPQTHQKTYRANNKKTAGEIQEFLLLERTEQNFQWSFLWLHCN